MGGFLATCRAGHPGRVGCCSGRCTPTTRAAAGGPALEQMACNDRWRQARLLP